MCGRTQLEVTETPQVLQTPGHPADYPANLRCVWYLTAGIHATVLVHFTALQIAGGQGCTQDKLTVQQVRASDPSIPSSSNAYPGPPAYYPCIPDWCCRGMGLGGYPDRGRP